jgi:hypothetical protein
VKSIVWAVGRALSQTFNHADTLHLTFSARSYMEAKTDPDWARIVRRIDRCLGRGHCRECWNGEVARARMILEIENGLQPWDVR